LGSSLKSIQENLKIKIGKLKKQRGKKRGREEEMERGREGERERGRERERKIQNR
jgi:hypothetical protein